MSELKKYKNKKNPEEIVEAIRTKNEFGKFEYCVYREPAGDNFWGDDWPEEAFLANYERIND